MPTLPLTYAPHPIFKQVAATVEQIDDTTLQLIDNMFDTLVAQQGLGMAATMVGIAVRIAVVDMQTYGTQDRLTLINPVIVETSKETHSYEEASLCFPGISAPITRPSIITVTYQDRCGTDKEITADGFLSSVIQHEIDYMNGTVYLDYLSRTKRDMLLKKMQKYMKHHMR